jgi:hypothetical protein
MMAESAAQRFKRNRTNMKNSVDKLTKRTPYRDTIKDMSSEQIRARLMTSATGEMRKTYDRPEFKEFKDHYTKKLLKERDSGAYDFRKKKKK